MAQTTGVTTLPYLVVGGLTFAGGVVLMLRHLHVWRAIADATRERAEIQFFSAQFRRRMLTSASIAVLGFVIASLFWARDPTSFTILMAFALFLTVTIMVLASLDLLSVSYYVRKSQQSSDKARRELLKQYEDLKARRDRNRNEANEDDN